MLLEQGWLVGARRVPSPHYDCRPDDETPTLLVVHNISLPPGEFGGPWIDALFTGTIDPQAHPFFAEIAHLRVSAHCLIRRDGEIYQPESCQGSKHRYPFGTDDRGQFL